MVALIWLRSLNVSWRLCAVEPGLTKLSRQKLSAEKRDDVQVRLKLTENKNRCSEISVHHSCYCTFTSKDKIARAQKKKADNFDGLPVSPRKTRPKSQTLRGPDDVVTFDFSKYCLFCGQDCVSIDPRHPERWDRVVKHMTNERPGAPTFKDVILDVAEQRNEVASRVKHNLRTIIDLPAVDAQYHKRCYSACMRVPKHPVLPVAPFTNMV